MCKSLTHVYLYCSAISIMFEHFTDNEHIPVDKTVQTYMKMIKYVICIFNIPSPLNQNITSKLKHTKVLNTNNS